MDKHHRYGPSRWERIAECPGSPRMEDDYPEKADDADREEGTMLHERVATGDLSDLTTEQEGLVQQCLDLVEELSKDAISVDKEQRLPLRDGWAVVTFGTVDVVIRNTEDEVTVIDWKFGRNPVKPANQNRQAAAYGAMAAKKYKATRATVHFFQPRIHVHTKHTFVGFDAIIENYKADIARCEQPGLILCAGEWCGYCSAICECPAARQNSALTVTNDVAAITADNAREYLTAVRTVEKYGKKVKAELVAKMLAGEELPGLRLKKRGGSRKISNPQEAWDTIGHVVPLEAFLSAVNVSVPKLEEAFCRRLQETDGLTLVAGRKRAKELLDPLTTVGADSYSADFSKD